MEKILLFSASWCGPCKTYKPLLTKFCADNHIALEVIDVDMDSVNTVKYGIKSIPTTIIVGRGDKLTGAQTLSTLESLI